MTVSPLSAPHHVAWDSLPRSLRPEVESTARWVARIAWNIFSLIIFPIGLIRLIGYGLAIVARKIILQANSSGIILVKLANAILQTSASLYQARFESIPVPVTTPDGAQLSAHLFRHRGADQQTPTVICLGGNGELKGLAGTYAEIMKRSMAQEQPMNVVIFDYRSVDRSTGEFKEGKDFLVDALSIVDWVRKRVGTPNHKIHFHGFSLGGAIALKTKAANPTLTGRLVSVSSFSTIGEVVEANLLQISVLLKPIALLAKWILKVQGLELDAAADLPKLQGRKLILYHPHDPVIPWEGSLAARAQEDFFPLGGPPQHSAPFTERTAQFLFA